MKKPGAEALLRCIFHYNRKIISNTDRFNDSYMPLKLAEVYTPTTLHDTIEDQSVEAKFHYKVAATERRKVDSRCLYRESGCSWRIYATPTAGDNDYILREQRCVMMAHTCLALGGKEVQSIVNRQSWLRRNISRWLPVMLKTPIQTIIDMVATRVHEQVNCEAVRLHKVHIVEGVLLEQVAQFAKLPVYCQRLVDQNPGIYAACNTISTAYEGVESQRFQRVFICPTPASLGTLRLSRPFIAVDGTFLKTRWAMVLLLAVAVDGNGEAIILAWAVVESESADAWKWFLLHLGQQLPAIISATIMSDRGKGLLAAEEVLGPDIIKAYCCVHLLRNLIKAYGKSTEQFFWPIAKATSQDQ